MALSFDPSMTKVWAVIAVMVRFSFGVICGLRSFIFTALSLGKMFFIPLLSSLPFLVSAVTRWSFLASYPSRWRSDGNHLTYDWICSPYCTSSCKMRSLSYWLMHKASSYCPPQRSVSCSISYQSPSHHPMQILFAVLSLDVIVAVFIEGLIRCPVMLFYDVTSQWWVGEHFFVKS